MYVWRTTLFCFIEQSDIVSVASMGDKLSVSMVQSSMTSIPDRDGAELGFG